MKTDAIITGIVSNEVKDQPSPKKTDVNKSKSKKDKQDDHEQHHKKYKRNESGFAAYFNSNLSNPVVEKITPKKAVFVKSPAHESSHSPQRKIDIKSGFDDELPKNHEKSSVELNAGAKHVPHPVIQKPTAPVLHAAHHETTHNTPDFKQLLPTSITPHNKKTHHAPAVHASLSTKEELKLKTSSKESHHSDTKNTPEGIKKIFNVQDQKKVGVHSNQVNHIPINNTLHEDHGIVKFKDVGFIEKQQHFLNRHIEKPKPADSKASDNNFNMPMGQNTVAENIPANQTAQTMQIHHIPAVLMHHMQAGTEHIVIHLNPKQLGSIRIQIQTNQKNPSITIYADKKEGYEQLQGQMNMLLRDIHKQMPTMMMRVVLNEAENLSPALNGEIKKEIKNERKVTKEVASKIQARKAYAALINTEEVE